jgi:hypothetical protein
MESSPWRNTSPPDRVHRLTMALLATVLRVGADEALEPWEMELAAGHLFTTLICTLGVQHGMSAETIIAHAQGLGPLLVKDVRGKLAHGPFPMN